MNPLFNAVRLGSAKLVIDSIYRDRAACHAADDTGRTPLHWAALTGTPGIVTALLCAGAKTGVADQAGKTPLTLAQEAGRTEAAALLAGAASR